MIHENAHGINSEQEKALLDILNHHLPGKFSISTQTPFVDGYVPFIEKLRKFELSKKLIARGYGCNAQHCVRGELNKIVNILKTELNHSCVTSKEVNGLCVKYKNNYLSKLISPKNHNNVRLDDITKQINQALTTSKVNPVQVANAIRKGRTQQRRVRLLDSILNGKKIVTKFRKRK